jgi:DNA-binding response OmpR family regulator
MRILAIEDERQLSRHVTHALEHAGHSATTRFDAAEGLKAAVATPPDLVVLDLNLPDRAQVRGARHTDASDPQFSGTLQVDLLWSLPELAK